MSEAVSAGRVRLLDLLRRADTGEQIDIPDRVPVEEAAEACVEGNAEGLQYWTEALNFCSQWCGSVGVRHLSVNGLREPRGPSVHVARWPPRLRQWLQHVRAARDHVEKERQESEALRFADEEAERQARISAEEERAVQAEAAREARRTDDALRFFDARERNALSIERDRVERVAAAVVERMGASLPVEKLATSSRHKTVDGDVEVGVSEIKELPVRTFVNTKDAIKALDKLGFVSSRTGSVSPLFAHPERHSELFASARGSRSELWGWEELKSNFERHGTRGRAGMKPRLVNTGGGGRRVENT